MLNSHDDVKVWDEFAGRAMTELLAGVISVNIKFDKTILATECFDFADAMMTERQRRLSERKVMENNFLRK